MNEFVDPKKGTRTQKDMNHLNQPMIFKGICEFPGKYNLLRKFS